MKRRLAFLLLFVPSLLPCYSYLSHRSVPGSPSQSSHTHSDSSPPCRYRCAGRGWTGTVWAALWSMRASLPPPSGPQPAAGCLCSARPQIDLWCSLRTRSSTAPSTPEEEDASVESWLLDCQNSCSVCCKTKYKQIMFVSSLYSFYLFHHDVFLFLTHFA